MSKTVKPKPVIGKCDTPSCINAWVIVQHAKATAHAGVDAGKKIPVSKVCEKCWKRRT